MFTKLSRLLHSWARGRVVLLLLVSLILFMGITWPILPRIYPEANELESLDALAFHTADQVLSIVDEWGNDGRTYELWLHTTWDVVVPVLSFFTIGLSVSWLLQRGFSRESRLQSLNLLALGTAFDLLENISLIVLIAVHPRQLITIAWLKTIFTTAKYCLAVPLLLVVVIGGVMAARNRFRLQ
jgi:hypothetical protein